MSSQGCVPEVPDDGLVLSMNLSRRNFLKGASATGVAFAAAPAGSEEPKRYQQGTSPWPLALNSSTIRPTPLKEQIPVAADAGWDALEVWIDDLARHEEAGGSIKDLGAEIRDRGMFVPNVIGLWDSMPADADAWKDSLTATRQRMRMAAEVGSTYVAAIPTPDRADFDLKYGADCYRDLLRIGREDYGITVAVEFVGFLKGVHRIGQACAIALDANDPDACVVADTFHLFRGGSGFEGIKLLSGEIIANFHWNDVPEGTPREGTGDAARVYPGDGMLPLTQALKDLKAIGYTRTLSLELFNREHWKQDPKVVAETGLRKMREGIALAGV